MKNLNISATANSPEILYDNNKKILFISGDSYPENAFEFYKPLFNWLNDYLGPSADSLQINISLHYFNSSTSKILYDFLDQLEEANCNDLSIRWYHDPENELTMEAGEEFQEDYESLNFELIAQPSA